MQNHKHFHAGSSIAVLLLLFCAAFVTPTTAEETAHTDLSYFVNEAGERQAISTEKDWQQRRKQIVANMEKVMGKFPSPEKPVPLEMKVLETVDVVHSGKKLQRQKVSYHTDSTTAVVHAYLFLPETATEKSAAMLCLHQTTNPGKGEPAGIAGSKNLHYAIELAAEGFVTLAPDYPSFGEYEYDFDKDDFTSGTMKAIYDNTRAVDLLCSLPQVDASRIGCIGHSLGGHNTLFTAVFEPRIKVSVTSCGFTRFHKYYGGKLKGWTSARYMPAIDKEYGNNPDLVPFDFPEILAAISPRAVLACSPVRDDNFEVSGVKDSIAAAMPIFKLQGAEAKLQALYPECAHDFTPETRAAAYAFIKQQLAR